MYSLRIRPLYLGEITRQNMLFAYWEDPGTIINAPIIAWYIEGGDKKILVDTGGGNPNDLHASRFMPYKREKKQAIENVLDNMGIKCENIDIVIATHLHWDHCAGNKLFKNAKIIVQEEELLAARSPFPVQHGYVKDLIEGIEYTVISGDVKIVEGVTAILTPGHTYGFQGVLVDASNERYFIAGDNIGLFSNLKRNPPLISGIYVDLKMYYESLEKMRKLSAIILPGHDKKVCEKEIYA